jgi:hypothetical protein
VNEYAVGRGQFDQFVDELENPLPPAPALRSATLLNGDYRDFVLKFPLIVQLLIGFGFDRCAMRSIACGY